MGQFQLNKNWEKYLDFQSRFFKSNIYCIDGGFAFDLRSYLSLEEIIRLTNETLYSSYQYSKSLAVDSYRIA